MSLVTVNPTTDMICGGKRIELTGTNLSGKTVMFGSEQIQIHEDSKGFYCYSPLVFEGGEIDVKVGNSQAIKFTYKLPIKGERHEAMANALQYLSGLEEAVDMDNISSLFAMDEDGRNMLHYACVNEFADMARKVIHLVHKAPENDEVSDIQEIVRVFEVFVMMIDNSNKTALDYAVIYGSFGCVKAFFETVDESILKRLIKRIGIFHLINLASEYNRDEIYIYLNNKLEEFTE